MATLSVIRSCALREHLSIRVIARKTGLYPNTIHECLPYDSVQAQLAKRTIVTQLYPFAASCQAGCLRWRKSICIQSKWATATDYRDLVGLRYYFSLNT